MLQIVATILAVISLMVSIWALLAARKARELLAQLPAVLIKTPVPFGDFRPDIGYVHTFEHKPIKTVRI